MTTVFGTCRLNHIKHNNINNLVNYCHCTKEIIQMIDWLESRVQLNKPYFFRTAIRSNENVQLTLELQELWRECDTVVCEICSRKKYEFIPNVQETDLISNTTTTYLHHLCVDPRFFKYNDSSVQYRLVIQSDEEIEHDLLTIQDLIGPHRKLLIVTHYDAYLDGQLIPSRHNLIACVERLSAEHGWLCVNPTKVLKDYPQHEVMTADLGHYTLKGEQIISNYVDEIISNFCKNC